MKLPNAEHAVIAPEKLRDYLLNSGHRRGASKARLLLSMGYSADEWTQLEADLREQHLLADAEEGEPNDYGTRYLIVAELRGPDGRAIVLRSVWQIDLILAQTLPDSLPCIRSMDHEVSNVSRCNPHGRHSGARPLRRRRRRDRRTALC